MEPWLYFNTLFEKENLKKYVFCLKMWKKLIIDTYEKLIKVHNVLRKYILNRNKKICFMFKSEMLFEFKS